MLVEPCAGPLCKVAPAQPTLPRCTTLVSVGTLSARHSALQSCSIKARDAVGSPTDTLAGYVSVASLAYGWSHARMHTRTHSSHVCLPVLTQPPKFLLRARVWAALFAEFLGLAIFQIYGGSANDDVAAFGNGITLCILGGLESHPVVSPALLCTL